MPPTKKRKKSVQKPTPKAPPIVFVPDKSYINDGGSIFPINVILVSDPIMYEKMSKVLEAWGKEPMGVSGKRGDIEG